MSSLDPKVSPILYSVGTQLSYDIANKFYHNVHYVWCTTDFKSIYQPPTSRPETICNRWLDIISTGDIHAREIDDNISGILRGAKIKKDNSIISDKEKKYIQEMVYHAEFHSFFPVIYIIYTEKVITKIQEVVPRYRASKTSVEYIIDNLEEGEFQVLFQKDILHNVIIAQSGKVR